MHRVCSLTDLEAAGGRLAVTVGPRELLILEAAGAVFAVDRACPHEGFRLDRGEVARGVLTCPAHGWRFELTTGTCLVPGDALRTYRVVLADGEVLVDDAVEPTARERELATEGLLAALERGRPALAARRTSRLAALGVPAEGVAALLARYGGSHAEAGLEPEVAVVADVLDAGDDTAWPIVAAGIAERLARCFPRFGAAPATSFAWEDHGIDGTLEALVLDGDADGAEGVTAGMLDAEVAVDQVVAGLAAGTAARFRGLWPLVVLERAARLARLGAPVARAVIPVAAYGCAAGEGRPLPDVPAPPDAIGRCAAILLEAEDPHDSALGCALALAHAQAAAWAISVAGERARPALGHAVGAALLFGRDRPVPRDLGRTATPAGAVRAETARGYAICQAAAHAASVTGHPLAAAAVARLLARPRRERFVAELIADPSYELL